MAPSRVHIFGLGVTGRALVDWFLRNGWMVIATDDRFDSELEMVANELRSEGAEVLLGGHRGALQKKVDLVVLSPGIAPGTPSVQDRIGQGVEVIGEIEFGWRNIRGITAAITGANGKSTTTALLGEIFSKTGRQSFTVGNIGKPLIDIADLTDDNSLISLEVSSYQLETIVDFKPFVAALLNITPDHLERHGSMEGYGRAKAKIWQNQTNDDFLIFNADDPITINLVKTAQSTKIPFSVSGPLTVGVWLENGMMVANLPGMDRSEFPRTISSLPGRHNEENLLAAIAMAKVAGIADEYIEAGLKSFKGLPHRLEFVREINGVKYINDSKATNVDAGKCALKALNSPIILLAGGRQKKGGFKDLRDIISEKVRQIYSFGEGAEEIERDLGDLIPVKRLANMEEAIMKASKFAIEGDTILLSPLCASFDQFKNFEHRGDVFRELVRNIR